MDSNTVAEIEAGLASSDEDRRWQAATRLGERVEAEPDAVWALVARWGSCDDSDTRMAIATCVLAHVLEHHFELIFPRLEPLAAVDARFADTVSSCWRFGESALPANGARLEALQERLRSHGAA